MVKIKSFKGVLYNKTEVASIADVTAPPYDVISPQEQQALYNKSEKNIVRLILGKDDPSDNPTSDRYTRAAGFFDKWLADGTLKVDEEPTIYIYEQGYPYGDKENKRIGFIALMKVGERDLNSVMMHEKTFLKPKEDRLNLIRAVKANLSPIFTLFEDKDSSITNKLRDYSKDIKPDINICIDDVHHRLWRIKEAILVSQLIESMNGRDVFIADGHHRFEVAAQFASEGGFDHVMTYFSSLNDEALTIFPTHRIIKEIAPLDQDRLLNILGEKFTIKEADTLEGMLKSLNAERRYAFGLYCGDKKIYLITLKDNTQPAITGLEDKSELWKKLDVVILHEFMLKRLLGIRLIEGNVAYVKDAGSAIEAVDRNDFKLAFFLRPTRIEQVQRIAMNGERMPHKSTYFYPKLLTGLVINKFD
ncbi:MAG: DUF1015 domain-containing protein [Candidatus Omnitrophica bacterium]|nr:DUF1015 domain-containing protein [Candidatus Omnitrophota bacterium]